MRDFWRKHVFVPPSFVVKPCFWNEVYQFAQHKILGCAGNLSRYITCLDLISKANNFFHAHVFKAKALQHFTPPPFTVLMCFFGDDNKLLCPKSEIFSLSLENSIKAIEVWFCFNSSSCIYLFYFCLYIVSRFPVLASAEAWLSFSE